jgi:hypothetical protein
VVPELLITAAEVEAVNALTPAKPPEDKAFAAVGEADQAVREITLIDLVEIAVAEVKPLTAVPTKLFELNSTLFTPKVPALERAATLAVAL